MSQLMPRLLRLIFLLKMRFLSRECLHNEVVLYVGSYSINTPDLRSFLHTWCGTTMTKDCVAAEWIQVKQGGRY